MKIKRIYIKDLGIFREEKLENINSNIVIIGGHNRAGKSTFMELLRCVGFGFLGKSKLPQANTEYDMNCDIQNHKGQTFNVSLKGNRQPVVKNLSGEEKVSISDIYNIDYTTYKQLFTISLDELQNYSMKNSKQLSKISTILLGAGFNEIAKIPEILKELNRKSIKIGGKTGNPSTAAFKQSNKNIKKGIELRKKASNEVDEYYEKSKELTELKEKVQKEQTYVKKLCEEVSEIKTVKGNLKIYLRLKDIKQQLSNLERNKKINKFTHFNKDRIVNLKEEYQLAINDYEDRVLILKQNIGEDMKLKDKLISYKDIIYDLSSNISGIRQKIQNYKEIDTKCVEERKKIRREIVSINPKWDDDFAKIMSIKTDIISIEEINLSVDNYNKLMYEKKLVENEISTVQTKKNLIQKSKSENELLNMNHIVKNYFYIAILIFILGVIISFINYKISIILMIMGLGIGGTYSVIKYSSGKGNDYNNHIKENHGLDDEFRVKNEKLKGISVEIEKNSDKIKKTKLVLDIKEDISGEILKEYFKRIISIKEKIINLGDMVGKAQRQKKEIDSIFNSMTKLYDLFNAKEGVKQFDCSIQYNVQSYEQVFSFINELKNNVELAEEVNIFQSKKNLIKEKILQLIGKEYDESIFLGIEEYIYLTEKHKEILDLKTEKNIIENSLKGSLHLQHEEEIESAFRNYSDYDTVQQKYDEKAKKLNNLKDEVELLKEHIQKLTYEIDRLKTTEKFEEADVLIDKGRKDLKILAKKYAALKSAQYILEKLQKDFIEKAKDTLLKGASEYLRFITQGEYTEIIPSDDLLDLDFKTVLENGSVNDNSDMLSRATKEQLFLAVRLSRIKEIKPSLPIILDDSLVNFDENHTKQTLKLLSHISKENQIFITTCHPKVIEYCGNLFSEAQYWKLENGSFTLSNKKELKEYLK